MIEDSLLSVRFYENDIVKSYDCHLIDDDTIRINVCHNSIEIDHVLLNSSELRKILTELYNDVDEYYYIDHVKIKKSYLNNLRLILD